MGYIKTKILGCPIPIIYDENNKPHPIPDMLPVVLPKITKLESTGNH